MNGLVDFTSPHQVNHNLHQIFRFELRASPFPRIAELLLHESRVIITALRFECLLQSEERTRIAGIMVQILAKHLLCSSRVIVHEQGRAQRFSDREIPVRRLAIVEAILHGYAVTRSEEHTSELQSQSN